MDRFGIPSQRAEEALRTLISSGGLPLGSSLPSERDLAHRLGMGRVAVRRAVRQLEIGGWIRHDGGYRRSVVGTPKPVATVTELTGIGSSYCALAGTALIFERIMHVRGAKKAAGWCDWVTVGMAEHLAQRKISAVSIDPERCDDDLIDRIVHERPLGLLVPYEGHPEMPHFMERRDRLAARLQLAGIPVVMVGDSPQLQTHDRVAADQDKGWQMAVNWLAQRGFTRILPMIGPSDWWVEMRMTGYRRVTRTLGLETLRPLRITNLGPLMSSSLPDRDSSLAHTMAGFLLAQRGHFDAILTVNDILVAPVRAGLDLIGIDPSSIPVVGYDDLWSELPDLLGKKYRPTITLDQRQRDQGIAACELLFERIDGKLPDGPTRRLVPPRLIEIPPA